MQLHSANVFVRARARLYVCVCVRVKTLKISDRNDTIARLSIKVWYWTAYSSWYITFSIYVTHFFESEETHTVPIGANAQTQRPAHIVCCTVEFLALRSISCLSLTSNTIVRIPLMCGGSMEPENQCKFLFILYIPSDMGTHRKQNYCQCHLLSNRKCQNTHTWFWNACKLHINIQLLRIFRLNSTFLCYFISELFFLLVVVVAVLF